MEESVELKALQEDLKEAYRTDHLTLPAPPVPDNEERQKASMMERKMILNPNADDNTVIDNRGTTLKEHRDRLLFGVMPKDAPKEALASIGKHSVTLREDGAVVVNPPNKVDRPVVISAPKVQEGKTDFGSELAHSTTPVAESAQTLPEEKQESVAAISEGTSAEVNVAPEVSASRASRFNLSDKV